MAALGILLLLVVGISRLVGGGGDSSEAKATDVSSRTRSTTSAAPSPSPTGGTDATGTGLPGAAVSVGPSTSVAPTPSATLGASPTLPAPTGICSDDDVVVTPSVTDAQATRTVLVRLTLRTMVTTACTWRTSPKAIQVKITSGSDRVWSTIDCPHAVPTQSVVVRRDTDTVVNVAWNSRRSDATCSGHTQWAMPGYYHVAVAALGGEPQDIQFALRRPRPLPKPTPTPTPTRAASAAPTTGARQEPQTDPSKVRKKSRRVD
ncbi:hypothetical protein JCM18899A_33890 [Nocardioides sp. AN3]